MADCVDPKLMELIARNVVFKLINEHTLQSGLRSCDASCGWLSHEARVATCAQLDAAVGALAVGDTIESFTYDSDTGLVTITTDAGNFYVTLPIPEPNTDTYPVSLVLGADYVLSLVLNDGTTLTTSFQPVVDLVQAFTDKFLHLVGYNPSTHTLTFEVGADSGSGSQVFTVDLSTLIPITVAPGVCLDGDGTAASPLSLDLVCLAQHVAAQLNMTIVTLSDDPAEPLGVAAAGIASKGSRQDHVHPMPSAADVGALGAGDTAVAAAKLATAHTIGGIAFDGTGDIDPSVTVVEVTTGRALALTDRNKRIVQRDPSPQVLTIPAQSAVTWVGPTTILIQAVGSGDCTLAADAGVTLNGVVAGSVLLDPYQVNVLNWDVADNWFISGTSGNVA